MFIVIGTTTIDLFVSGIDKMPRVDGDEYTVSSLAWCSNPLTMTCGGNGANTAYILAMLGAPVTLGSAVGPDALGEIMSGWLTARGVDLRALQRRAGYGTSTNTQLLDERRNRLNFYHPGPLTALTMADLPPEIWGECEALLLTSYPIMTGLRGEGYRRALVTARAAGAITAIDIGPAIGELVTVEELAPLLPLTDYLITNDYELGVCTGCESDLAFGANRLLQAGAQQVLVKQGAAGATLYRAEESPLTVPGYPVEAKVTVGAGDSFNAGFLFALRAGMTVQRAIQFGNATAALVVRTGQSVLGAPDRSAVEQFMAARV
jgi:sugar/nucleoside kinase (ribokinase family)